MKKFAECGKMRDEDCYSLIGDLAGQVLPLVHVHVDSPRGIRFRADDSMGRVAACVVRRVEVEYVEVLLGQKRRSFGEQRMALKGSDRWGNQTEAEGCTAIFGTISLRYGVIGARSVCNSVHAIH